MGMNVKTWVFITSAMIVAVTAGSMLTEAVAAAVRNGAAPPPSR